METMDHEISADKIDWQLEINRFMKIRISCMPARG
jgi:hypothetical protein